MAKKATTDYQRLFENHPMARFIVTVGKDNLFTYANCNQAAYTLFNLRENDPINQPVSTIFATANIAKACAACVANKTPMTVETSPLHTHVIQKQSFILNPIIDKKGHVYLIDMIATPYGKDIDEIKMERDTAISLVQEQRHAKEEADGANRAKSAFLTNMSHELRTPLNAIIGFSELIRDETFGPIDNKKYKEYLTDIHFSAHHLLEIINDVLDMSKIEAGKFILVENKIDLPVLFDSVKRIIAERASAKGVKMKTAIKDDVPLLYADRRVMRQILLNLVSNAIKFSKQGDVITLKGCVTKAGDLKICVKDTGLGIAQDNINKVLEPFNQTYDPSINNGQNGTGLGLSLTKAMTELHGGSLAIKSALGKGTTVSITLPKTRVLSVPQHIKNIA